MTITYRTDCGCGYTYNVGAGGGIVCGGDNTNDDGIIRASGGGIVNGSAIVKVPTQAADGMAIWMLSTDYSDVGGLYDGTAGAYEPVIEEGLYCLYSLDFDSTGSINLPNIPFEKWSISCWIMLEEWHADKTIFSMGDFSLRHSPLNQIYCSFGINDGTNDTVWDCYSSETLDLNRWHHIAATWDGTTCSIYLDGELSNSDDMTAGYTLLGDTGGYIGRNELGSYFDGNIQDVRFNSEVKTAAWFQAEIDNYCNREFWGIVT